FRVEFPGEIRGCGLQNLVRPPQLTVLPLQFGDPLRVAGRGPGALPAIDLDLPDPGPQRLTVHAELVGHPGDRAGLHTGLFTQLKHHPDRAFTQLWRVLPRGCHSPSPFQVSGPPPKPGRSTPLIVAVVVSTVVKRPGTVIGFGPFGWSSGVGRGGVEPPTFRFSAITTPLPRGSRPRLDGG